MIEISNLQEVKLYKGDKELCYDDRVANCDLEGGDVVVQVVVTKSIHKAGEMIKTAIDQVLCKATKAPPPQLPPQLQVQHLLQHPPSITPFREGKESTASMDLAPKSQTMAQPFEVLADMDG